MPGPIPDPHTSKRNRSTRALPTRHLPVSGYQGPIPEPTLDLVEGSLQEKIYRRAWRSPQAASWHESDADLVAEWAGLKALVAHALQMGEDVQAAILSQIVSREDRLLFSPSAKLKARAEVVDDPPDEVDDDDDVSKAWKPQDFAS